MLGVMPGEAAERVTYDEFVEFCAWQSIKWQQAHRIDYYLAQITGYLAGKEKWRISDYLLKFRPGTGGSAQKPLKLTASALKRGFGIGA